MAWPPTDGDHTPPLWPQEGGSLIRKQSQALEKTNSHTCCSPEIFSFHRCDPSARGQRRTEGGRGVGPPHTQRPHSEIISSASSFPRTRSHLNPSDQHSPGEPALILASKECGPQKVVLDYLGQRLTSQIQKLGLWRPRAMRPGQGARAARSPDSSGQCTSPYIESPFYGVM